MIYAMTKKLIIRKKEGLDGTEYEAFCVDVKEKLGIFLLNDDITKEQHEELIALLVKES